jgi:hypothetical protein
LLAEKGPVYDAELGVGVDVGVAVGVFVGLGLIVGVAVADAVAAIVALTVRVEPSEVQPATEINATTSNKNRYRC